MSIELPEMDPNLVEVLEDVASSAGSSLWGSRHFIRTPRSVNALGSSPPLEAERHLLSCYREEAAFLLRCLAVQALQRAPRTVMLFALEDPRQVKARMASLMGEDSGHLMNLPGYAALARCVAPKGRASFLDLVSSSIQLAESPQSWIFLIHGYLALQQPHSARRIALRLLRTPSSPEMRRYAFVGLGMSEQVSSRPDRALAAFRESLDLSIRHGFDAKCLLLSGLNSFFSALRIGSFEQAGKAMSDMLHGMDLEDSSLAWIRRVYGAQECAAEYRSLARAFGAGRGRGLEPNAQEVLDAFAV